MNCSSVRAKLAGYMDGTIAGATQAQERIYLRKHLDECSGCREELERFRKLSALLSRVPRSLPPANLATRIRVAAAQSTSAPDAPSRWRRMRDRAEILLDNVFRPITLPATGGFFSASSGVCGCATALIVPGITVRAVQNDVPLNILRPAELISCFRTIRRLGRRISMTRSWRCRMGCCSTLQSMRTAAWWDTRFCRGRAAAICDGNSIRCCCFRDFGRC